jgi:hypothetical protein
MPKLYTYRTPLGHFSGAAAAARAHGVDKSTIMNRCETQPAQYQKIAEGKVQPTKKKLPAEPTLHATKRTWPLSWYQYRLLDFDTRESIWLTWCAEHQLNPELESTVDAFFDEMDSVPEVVA